MRAARNFIILVLIILIKIGDFVLFICSFLLVIIKKLGILGRIRKATKRQKPIKGGLAKPKLITLFPLPFFTKLRYFVYGTFFSLVCIFIPLLFYIFLQELPSPKELTRRHIPQTTKIYDRNGTLLYQIYATENRTLVPFAKIPRYLQLATIAIEDKDFYKHPGFNISAIIRSAVANASGKNIQGGSTITQQLIKSALLTPETNVLRKIKEVVLAFWAERLYAKNQILELYFNQVPYGGTAWGVEAAAQTYFGKHVRDLSLAESAFLAGVPQAPTLYSPFGTNPLLWKTRQKEVLRKMVALNYISPSQASEAEAEELQFQIPQTPIHAPHFVMYVKDLLVKKYGLPVVERGGLTVVTSLDLPLHNQAQEIVEEEVWQNSFLNLTNGAALITNPQNGDILAMVGSRDFEDPNGGNVNVTTSSRQPGSAIKIVTYSLALQKGLTAATILDDSPITYTTPGSLPYSPVNYDGKFHGKVPLRLAFANSFNVPAVKTLSRIGIESFLALGKKMGMTSWGDPSRYGLSITLGGAEVTMLEMATAYGVLPNNGARVDLNPILKVTDVKGNVLEEKKEVVKHRVIDEGVAFIISDILADNQARTWEFGPNSTLQIPGKTVSVKTGTSDNKRDNWTIGYTKNWLVAVWVGNNDNSPMSQTLASGITGAAPIWNKIMSLLLANASPQRPIVPSNVVRKQCLGRMEYFIRGTENSVNCTPLPSPSPSPSP